MNPKWMMVCITCLPHGVLVAQSPERKVLLSLTDNSESARHHIAEGRYMIKVTHSEELRDVKQVSLSVQGDHPGQWGESKIEHGHWLVVKHSGGKEPRACSVTLAKPLPNDPAEDYQRRVMERVLGSGENSETTAQNEIERLSQQYARSSEHVLRLPRSVRSRQDPLRTLERLCRWIAYDRLFMEFKLDTRPTFTETDAKAAYVELLGLLKDGSPKHDGQEGLLSEAERKRVLDSIRFTYSVSFVPYLAAETPDRNWMQAHRVDLGHEQIGQVVWRGTLGQGPTGSAWLAIPDVISIEELKISTGNSGDSAKITHVDGAGGWQYFRMFNDSGQQCSFNVRLIRDAKLPSVEILQTNPSGLEFPF